MPPANAPVPTGPRPQERFRWEIIALPLAVVVGLWLLTAFELPLCWDSVLSGIENRARFSAVCVFAAICSALLACMRVLGRR